ncbi:hypothetical protein EBBID32_45500 [Sphingobium indicum BiD32]|uniref:DUF3987 domain-containing protein n=2 Tax=Sphingobium indicum TaxID=332055 RepID=N1MTV7_9SPHN|nr:hypothetical protein EBBID32_45500 [Sphingobium indicum BiD32]
MGEVAKGEKYPIHALGETIGGAVAAISEKVMVPPALAANSVLSACSLAVQPYVNVLLPIGDARPVSLFLVTVAESGDRKSTTDNLATGEIAVYQRELQEHHVRSEHEITARKLAWDASKGEALATSKKRGREAIEQALNDLGAKPLDPMVPTITVRVGTTQGLLKQFEIARPSLGLMSDEGGSWLGGYGLSEDNRLFTVATLSDLWDGQPVQRLTAGEGATSLYGRRLTFHMMIQPVLAGRLLGDAEFKGQGFLSRLLVAQPESLVGTRFVDPHAPVDDTIAQRIDSYNRRLAQIIRAKMPMDEDTRALRPNPVPLSRSAQILWWDFSNEMEKRAGKDGDMSEVRGFALKLAEHAARIAAVLSVFQQGPRIEEIEDEQMANGILLARYYLAEAARLFGSASPNPIIMAAQKVSDWLKDKWGENLISVGILQNFGPPAVKKKAATFVKDVIAVLVEHDHLSARLPSGGMVSGNKVRDVWRVQVRND